MDTSVVAIGRRQLMCVWWTLTHNQTVMDSSSNCCSHIICTLQSSSRGFFSRPSIITTTTCTPNTVTWISKLDGGGSRSSSHLQHRIRWTLNYSTLALSPPLESIQSGDDGEDTDAAAVHKPPPATTEAPITTAMNKKGKHWPACLQLLPSHNHTIEYTISAVSCTTYANTSSLSPSSTRTAWHTVRHCANTIDHI